MCVCLCVIAGISTWHLEIHFYLLHWSQFSFNTHTRTHTHTHTHTQTHRHTHTACLNSPLTEKQSFKLFPAWASMMSSWTTHIIRLATRWSNLRLRPGSIILHGQTDSCVWGDRRLLKQSLSLTLTHTHTHIYKYTGLLTGAHTHCTHPGANSLSIQ